MTPIILDSHKVHEPTPGYVFFALFSIIFMVIFSYTITNMAANYIVGDLGGSFLTSTYTISAFAVGNALGIPLGELLAHKWGGVKALLICLSSFAALMFLTIFADTFPVFILCRVLQGFVSGPFYFCVFFLLSQLADKAHQKKYTAIMITIFAVVPVVGASFGGAIAYEIDWRLIFLLNTIIILILISLVHVGLKHHERVLEPIPFDLVGYVFFAIGVVCLSGVITLGQELDWLRSECIITLLTIGSISTILFVGWTVYSPYPIIDLSLLKNPILFFALFNLSVLFSAYFGTVILLALWLSLYAKYTPVWIAMMLSGMSLAGFLPTLLIKGRGGKVDARIPLGLSILLFAVTSFYTCTFNVDINFGRISFSRIIGGFALVLFLPPLFRLAFRSVAEKRSYKVLGIFQFVRAISSGIGLEIYMTIWQRREFFYYQRLGGKLTEFSSATREFFHKAHEMHLNGLHAIKKLDYYLIRQSVALALDDTFYLMGWIMIALFILLLLTLFLPKKSFSPD